MRKKIVITSVLGLGIGLASWLSVTQVKAQSVEGFGLSVTPPVAYVTVQPGEKVVHTISLKYTGQVPVTITPRLVDFTPAESGSGIELDAVHSFPYLDPTQPEAFQQSFTLEPGQQTTFRLPISVPNSAATREFHLTTLFTANPTQELTIGATQTNIAGTIGSNLVILVSNDGRNLGQMSIKSIHGAEIVDSFGEIQLSVMAQNTGQTASVASGSAILKNMQGKIVKEYDIFPDVVLANSQRRLRFVEPGNLPTDESEDPPSPLENFVYDPAFLLGNYTFEIQLTDSQGKALTQSAYGVIALPISILVAILLGLLLILGYGITKKKEWLKQLPL